MMDVFHLNNLLCSSGILICALEVTAVPIEKIPIIVTAIAGVFGGAITQCTTYDERKPTKKVLIGEIMMSAVFGFAVYAAPETFSYMTGVKLPPSISGVTSPIILGAILAGAGSSKMWKKYANPSGDKNENH